MSKIGSKHSPTTLINISPSNTMAPALVEEFTVQETVGYKFGVGQYKEAAFGGPKVFRKDLELLGTDKHAPAKYPHYPPTWDNETMK